VNPCIVVAMPGSSAAKRVARILDALEKLYGRVRIPKAARPYELLVYQVCGYPASKRSCDAGFAALKASAGIAPEAILRASKKVLAEAMRPGGLYPAKRVDRLRAIATSALSTDENPDLVREMPLAKARKLLKTFPTIGDPGADRILLLARVDPVAAVPSNGLDVPLRLGLGKEQKNWAASYRSAQEALDEALPRTFDARIRAYLLFKTHGEETCKRSRPRCEECPLAKDCPYARAR
jgi:endonuclease III